MIPVYTYPKESDALWKKLEQAPTDDQQTLTAVQDILTHVASGGDKALLRYTEAYDHVVLTPKTMKLEPSVLEAAWKSLPAAIRRALQHAKKRLITFHKEQRRKSWTISDSQGFKLSQRWSALESAGLYVPGGIASYPSSVLMNAVPAQVAGVKRLVAVTPPNTEGRVSNAATLGALHLMGITEVYQVGGAQAVGALAYGTETIKPVDIIVGPGNRYVAAAKKLVYGRVKIDMIAGPSEVLVLADRSAPLAWIAADLLAQAEHDPVAQSICVLLGRRDAAALNKEIERQVNASPRREILMQSLPNHGAIVLASNEEKALEIINRKAAEHLELLIENPKEFAKNVKHAGSIFLGLHSVEAIGDYIAGPNHVLPTGGAAKRFSPLSVQDFLKMTQLIECSPKGLAATGPDAALLADCEGLDAHAQSIRLRLNKPEGSR
ncbi:MAG: histidinol dehydrogenase [Sumerlaeia bacterium]